MSGLFKNLALVLDRAYSMGVLNKESVNLLMAGRRLPPMIGSLAFKSFTYCCHRLIVVRRTPAVGRLDDPGQ